MQCPSFFPVQLAASYPGGFSHFLAFTFMKELETKHIGRRKQHSSFSDLMERKGLGGKVGILPAYLHTLREVGTSQRLCIHQPRAGLKPTKKPTRMKGDPDRVGTVVYQDGTQGLAYAEQAHTTH